MTKRLSFDDSDAPTDAAKTVSSPKVVGFLLRRTLTVVQWLICVVTLTTIATWFASSHWLADLCANLRVQQMIGLVALMVLVVCFRRWRWVGLCVVLAVAHLPAFWTLWTNRTLGPSRKPELVVMTANVWTPNQQHDAIAMQIQQADVDVLAILELGTPLHGYLKKSLAKLYPHQFSFPQDSGNFGIGIYSKYPLADTEAFSLNIDSILTLAATVEVHGHKYRVIATHPLPPMGATNFEYRNQHLKQLAAKVRSQQIPYDDTSMIVMGDLNLTPWSPLLGRFENESQVRRANCGRELTPTWYAYSKASFPFGLVLDHVLVSDDLYCVSHQVGEAIGSDHRAVIVGLARR